MRVLCVFCHPNRQSFSGQILDRVVAGLAAAGHEVQIADLYAEGFDPAFRNEDFVQFSADGVMPEDVLREQARVEWSEALVFVFPIWWWTFPAVLKGWIDRVFSYGWAWTDADKPGASPLEPRRALVLPVAGGSARMYEKYGYDRAITTMWDVGTWGYWGMREVRTHFFHDVNPGDLTDDLRQSHFEQAEALGRAF